MRGNGKFTERATSAITAAHDAAVSLGHSYVGTEHLLLGIAAEADGLGARVLRGSGIGSETLIRLVVEMSGRGTPGEPEQGFTKNARRVIERAAEDARGLKHSCVGTEHLLMGLLREPDCTGCAVLVRAGADADKLYTDILDLFGAPENRPRPQQQAARAPARHAETKILDQYSRDLTLMAAGGGTDPVIGREDEITRVIQILSRRTKNNPVLVGEPGVGKTAVAEGLAQRVVRGEVPDTLRNRRIVTLDIASMLAGTKYRGDFEDRVKCVINEVQRAGDVIVFIDELHTIVGAGSAEGAIDASNIIKPALGRGEIQVIGATTLDEYRRHIEKDAALDAAVKLSVRYVPDRFLPDKAVDLIDEAASRVHLEPRAAGAMCRAVTPGDVAAVVASWTGVPVEAITEDESRRLLRLEDALHRRVVGQNEAVCAVARAIRRGRVGLSDPKRPLGCFLFLGPTGVGKTELCRALAEAVYGDETAMIRFDMSEYMEKHAVSKLIGSPPGYVGYEEGGQLTERVRRHPWSVVLFDEIEKAHDDVYNLLLQIMEDGRLTDSSGRRADFRNTIVVMTSNIGAKAITDGRPAIGFSGGAQDLDDDARKTVMAELRQVFRPEFLNRVDDTIVFRRLTRQEVREIASGMLEALKGRMRALGVELRVTDAALTLLADEGFDPAFGARPLRRAICARLEDPAAEKLLGGEFTRGDTVEADAADGKLTLSRVTV